MRLPEPRDGIALQPLGQVQYLVPVQEPEGQHRNVEPEARRQAGAQSQSQIREIHDAVALPTLGRRLS